MRVLTEHWFASNMFCPRCGNVHIRRFENNRPVADFYCDTCNSEYELKSNHNSIDRKITDGAYGTMIQRITENNNPDLFCMRYEKRDNHVTDLIFIPKYFFTPSIIEKRKPLKDFLSEMEKVAGECYRVLKKGKFCAVLMGDTRRKGMVQSLGFETMRVFERAGFMAKEIVIKKQHNCKATGFWKTNSIKHNFLLLAHEYLFVFRK